MFNLKTHQLQPCRSTIAAQARMAGGLRSVNHTSVGTEGDSILHAMALPCLPWVSYEHFYTYKTKTTHSFSWQGSPLTSQVWLTLHSPSHLRCLWPLPPCWPFPWCPAASMNDWPPPSHCSPAALWGFSGTLQQGCVPRGLHTSFCFIHWLPAFHWLRKLY